MVGELTETHYETIKEQYESDQQQLSVYCNNSPTTIAVVSLPRDTGIDDACDEWMPELGMPERHLTRYWKYRSGFVTNSAVDDAAKRAYSEARLDHYYEQYVSSSETAQEAISAIVSRLNDGEDITLVCFEDSNTACHRHLLKEIIETRLSSEYQFNREKLSAD